MYAEACMSGTIYSVVRYYSLRYKDGDRNPCSLVGVMNIALALNLVV